jgi:DNA mismatch repair protein MutL
MVLKDNISKIHLLPDDLVNKIAAGEVIERPASVVKELVENSLDAKAHRVEIEIEKGGKKLIRVTDDGFGMTKDELKLAVSRHATSKIDKAEDLFNLNTLGFRGEALPSIASVSKMEILSCSSGAIGGRLIIDGGKVEKLEDFTGRTGTAITVKDLFFNVPARQKFLRSDSTEKAQIIDLVSKFILSRPGIAFRLVSDSEELISSPGSGKLEDAVLAVYGSEILPSLTLVSTEKAGRAQNGLKISGLISKAQYHRSERSGETFFVNGRWIRNAIIARELENAYQAAIPRGRYPFAVLFIEVDPKLVDVNVHPSKREVRFSRLDQVLSNLRNLVSEKIGQSINQYSQDQSEAGSFGQSYGVAGTAQELLIHNSFSQDSLPQIGRESYLEIDEVLPVLPLYQLKDSFIVTTDGESLLIIDQHAAHERILYEKLKHVGESQQPQGQGAGENNVTNSQSLLIPENLELEPALYAKVIENLVVLKGLGFEIEEFGGNTVLIRSIPAMLARVSARKLLQDFAEEAKEGFSARSVEEKREAILKSLACHGAIKAGERLSAPEISALIRDLYLTTNPFTCPHGRPTIFKVDEAEMRKRFER